MALRLSADIPTSVPLAPRLPIPSLLGCLTLVLLCVRQKFDLMSAPAFSDATLTRESQRLVIFLALPYRNGINSYVVYPGLRTNHVEQY